MNHKATLVTEPIHTTTRSNAYDSHRSMRHDLASEKAVEIGIRLQDILGTSDAAQFLKNNVIDIEVALRVLLRPEQRRKS